MDQTVIVTMFIPLGRESWEGFNRTDDEYINYFKDWAMVENDLFVYTIPKYEKSIIKIREELGLKEKTHIKIFDDFLKCDYDLYSKMTSAMNNEIFKKFRYHNERPESVSAVYNYVMMLKYFCLNETACLVQTNTTLVWHDFGWHYEGYDFNHYINFDQFNKITMFNVDEIDDNPIFNIVKWTRNYITGAVLIVPGSLCNHFWQLMRSNMISLVRCGLCDQDQTILLMACRDDRENIAIIPFTSYRRLFYKAIKMPMIDIKQGKYKYGKTLYIVKNSVQNKIKKIKYGIRDMQ